MVLGGDGFAAESESDGQVLDEVDAHDEAQLQERMKRQPELFPLEEMDLVGPLLVVGRETRLPSGAVDLLGVTRSGDVVVIEFKTGPQNPDFRSALSQVVDYGSDLWGMTFDAFEAGLAAAYFESARCPAGPAKGAKSLAEAAAATWPDWDEEEESRFVEGVANVLASGAFRYVVVAQRFTEAMERTAEYLNDQTSGAAFYLVELVRFSGDGISAFEARTVLKPTARSAKSSTVQLNEQTFLDQISHDGYREMLAGLFEWCQANGMVIFWGTKGISIRLKFPEKAEPVSVAWAHPPDVVGWYGLSGLTLGFDQSTAAAAPSTAPALNAYATALTGIPGGVPLQHKSLVGIRIDPDTASSAAPLISEALAALIEAAGS